MMSNEEFDRRIEFFLHRQAQFDADIQEIKEIQKRTDEKLELFTEGLGELRTLTHEGFKQTIRRFDAVARSFKVIAENSAITDARFRDTDVKINALIDSQLRTEEQLRKTDAKIDRHLKEDHNSGPQPDNP
jgi:hypothetical protein